MKYLGNAFSLQMLEDWNANVEIKEVSKRTAMANYEKSIIGHQDLATILGVECNRVTTKLLEGDTLFVAQYVGGRLPEGSNVLPIGAEIKFLQVSVKYKRLEIISMEEARMEFNME